MSLLQNIYDYIKSGETDTENLGLEIEHFVVDENSLYDIEGVPYRLSSGREPRRSYQIQKGS